MPREPLTTPLLGAAQATQFELSTLRIDFDLGTMAIEVIYYNSLNKPVQTTAFSGTFSDFAFNLGDQTSLRAKVKTRLSQVGAIN